MPQTPTPPADPAYLVMQDVADKLQVSTKTVRRWIDSGALPAYRVGRRVIRIRPADLDTFCNFPVAVRPDHPDVSA